MSDAVTLVSIVTPAVTGFAGLWFGASREDKRFARQSRLEYAKELGAVLDAGAQAISEAVDAFDRWTVAPQDTKADAGIAFDKATTNVGLMARRITLRVGAADAAAAGYSKAENALRELNEIVYNAHGQGLDHGSKPAARAVEAK